jgi:hypothetical protein
MGCSSHAAHMTDINPSIDTLCPSEPFTDAFHPGYPSSDESFLCQNFKTNCNVVPYGDHGSERLNYCKPTILLHVVVCPHIILLTRKSTPPSLWSHLINSGEVSLELCYIFTTQQGADPGSVVNTHMFISAV